MLTGEPDDQADEAGVGESEPAAPAEYEPGPPRPAGLLALPARLPAVMDGGSDEPDDDDVNEPKRFLWCCCWWWKSSANGRLGRALLELWLSVRLPPLLEGMLRLLPGGDPCFHATPPAPPLPAAIADEPYDGDDDGGALGGGCGEAFEPDDPPPELPLPERDRPPPKLPLLPSLLTEAVSVEPPPPPRSLALDFLPGGTSCFST